MRLQRALARAGIASRRHSEELISAGRVTVNGAVAHLGQSVDTDKDDIRVDGKPVKAAHFATWILLHKPSGVMTTRADPQGRQTVFDLVKDVPALTYVGRLDYLTEGVLLLTTDGAAANALTHPSFGVEREYVAIVEGNVELAVAQAREGVELDDGFVRPRQVASRRLGGGRSEFQVTISEGRKHEIRRLCKALDLTVDRLIRVRYGPVSLGTLPVGQSRPLTRSELSDIAALMEKGGGAPAMPVEPAPQAPRPSRKSPTRRPPAAGKSPTRRPPAAGKSRSRKPQGARKPRRRG
jgi:23S rRNA pseudouridine2605 synthase